jgi:hypothetical protein
MRSAAFVCIKCGARRVTLRARPGRTCRYRVFPALAVPPEVGIPTCGRCAVEYIDEHTAATLEPRLAEEYKSELRRRGKQALGDLSSRLGQARLERLLDVSQGYLCRLSAGNGTPSPQLVVLLALLARHPHLLDWVPRYWAEPRPMEERIEAPALPAVPRGPKRSRKTTELAHAPPTELPREQEPETTGARRGPA